MVCPNINTHLQCTTTDPFPDFLWTLPIQSSTVSIVWVVPHTPLDGQSVKWNWDTLIGSLFYRKKHHNQMKHWHNKSLWSYIVCNLKFPLYVSLFLSSRQNLHNKFPKKYRLVFIPVRKAHFLHENDVIVIEDSK